MDKKKILFRFLFVFLFATCASIEAIELNAIEVRSAASIPSSSRFRGIYGNVGPSFQIELSSQLRAPFELWSNVDWFFKHRDKGKCYKTRVNITNASLGLKYVYPLSENFDAYLGMGASLGRINLHNHSCCSKEKNSKLRMGGLLKSGIRYLIHRQIFLDVFVDYLYQPVHFHRHNVDIGGVKCGAGLGVGF